MVFLQLSQVTPWWITGQAEQVLEEVMGPVGIDWRATGVAENTMHFAFSLQQVSYFWSSSLNGPLLMHSIYFPPSSE